MWMSERNRNLRVQEAAAEMGTITMGGNPAGVSLGGERRWVSVYGPGGYSWRPTAGDKVLVLKTGAEGESPCILGTAQSAGDLKPGEVRLSGMECSLHLGQGQVELSSGERSSMRLGREGLEMEGGVSVNGQPLEDMIRNIAREAAREIISQMSK